MCELLGVTAKRKILMNELLVTFFSHSVDHRNGWGLAVLDTDPITIEREPVMALTSLYLKDRLLGTIETSKCIGHIRHATIGGDNIRNTHPFARYDISGRQWVLAHNGTIFDSEALAPYRFVQEGSTDSERILLYIIDRMGETYRRKGDVLGADERIRIIEDMVQTIVPGNKVNLLIYDGELFYVHKNERGTLHQKELEEGMLFATQPLTEDGWEEFPQNQLMVYKDGDLVYAGKKHDHTYVHNEERMKLLYLAYAGL